MASREKPTLVRWGRGQGLSGVGFLYDRAKGSLLGLPRPPEGEGLGEGACRRNCSIAYAKLNIPKYGPKGYYECHRHVPLMESEGGEPL